MSKLSNKTITRYIVEGTGIPRHLVKAMLGAISAGIAAELKAGRQVNIYRIGTFKVKIRPGRTVTWKNCFGRRGTLTRTMPDTKYVRFEPSPTLKSLVNGRPVTPNKWTVKINPPTTDFTLH